MKKLSFLLLTLFIASATYAQVLQKGDHAVNLGLGIPSVSYGSMSFPALLASYEMGFTEKLGIGYIGGGALIAYSGSNYGYSGYSGKYRYLTIGPRAAYHFDFVEITGSNAWDKIDVYAGVMMGLEFQTYKYDDINNVTYKDTDVAFASDVFVGIRYSFSESFGVYGEAGYGVSYLNGGVCLRF